MNWFDPFDPLAHLIKSVSGEETPTLKQKNIFERLFYNSRVDERTCTDSLGKRIQLAHSVVYTIQRGETEYHLITCPMGVDDFIRHVENLKKACDSLLAQARKNPNNRSTQGGNHV